MRIIRIAVISLVVLGVFLPMITLASDASNTDTNINTNISSIESIKTLFMPRSVFAKEPSNEIFKNPIEAPVKTDERLDQILFKWKEKQLDKWNKIQSKNIIINASAYTASADECGNSNGLTASGLKVQEKRTIACPPEYPFGVKIDIEGMGIYVCEDRGGAIKGNHVDIYMKTKKEAFAFGRKSINARIILE